MIEEVDEVRRFSRFLRRYIAFILRTDDDDEDDDN